MLSYLVIVSLLALRPIALPGIDRPKGNMNNIHVSECELSQMGNKNLDPISSAISVEIPTQKFSLMPSAEREFIIPKSTVVFEYTLKLSLEEMSRANFVIIGFQVQRPNNSKKILPSKILLSAHRCRINRSFPINSSTENDVKVWIRNESAEELVHLKFERAPRAAKILTKFSITKRPKNIEKTSDRRIESIKTAPKVIVTHSKKIKSEDGETVETPVPNSNIKLLQKVSKWAMNMNRWKFGNVYGPLVRACRFPKKCQWSCSPMISCVKPPKSNQVIVKKNQ